MKKLYYFLFMLPLLAIMAACSDDDKDLPKVDISIQYSGAVEQEDGAIAVAQGQTFTIDAITVTPAPGTKKAILGNTTYSMDGVPFYTIGVAPFGCEIGTSDLAVGDHSLSFVSQVFQEDREPGFAVYSMTVRITEPTEDPGEGGGTVIPEVGISANQM